MTRRQAVRRPALSHEVDRWLVLGEPDPQPSIWVHVLFGLAVVLFIVGAVWLSGMHG